MNEQYQITRDRVVQGLTRFANSTIHQNVWKDEIISNVFYVTDKKIGVYSSSGKKPDIQKAKEIALHSNKNNDFVSLPDVDEAGKPEYKGNYSEDTVTISPHTRASLVKTALAHCEKNGLHAAGFLSTGSYEKDIENSLGVKRFDKTSFIEFTITTTGEGTGHATGIAYDANLLDVNKLTIQAADTALKNISPVAIEPGKYRVLLEPLAVQTLFEFAAWYGLHSILYDENKSCFSGMLKKSISSHLLTVYDEPVSELPYLGIDGEGVARRKMKLINKGILEELPYDSFFAHKVNKKSTGTAQKPMSGGAPFSITVAPGNNDLNSMTGSIQKGLLIKRFWYTRIVSIKEGIITGMTRDGTYIIEDGVIGRAVKNLRFTVSLPNLLHNIHMIGDTCELHAFGKFPCMTIKNFAITGSTG